MSADRWSIAEWREVLSMTLYFRRLLSKFPLEGDTPERARLLDSMYKDAALKVYGLLNEEAHGDEEDLSKDRPL